MMTRRAFLNLCRALGIGVPLQTLTSLGRSQQVNDAPESVVIVGAGAAGLLSGYLLGQLGVKYQILEASSVHGGRMKRDNDFTDFPIPLGAEWLNTDARLLDDMVNTPSTGIKVDIGTYDPSTSYGYWEDGELSFTEIGEFDYQFFAGSSWFDFFDQYITPAVTQNILFDTIVTSVNYSGDDVVVSTQGGQRFNAEKVIVTAPVKILQDGDITFVPKLPQRKVDAINNVTFWDGMKVFINFAEAFYPTFLEFADTERQLGDRVYYDAAYGRPTDANILGFFLIGEPVNRYKDLSDDALKNVILAELDEIFAGQASQHY
ncbi:MAG: FAD-dependent oxidoreductase, partial [Deinococcota bacterium]